MIYLSAVDDLVHHPPLREVVQDLLYRADPTQETCASIDYADFTHPTRQHELRCRPFKIGNSSDWPLKYP